MGPSTPAVPAGRRLLPDVPAHRLVTVAYTVSHAAATETSEGRLAAADVEHAIVETLLGADQPRGRQD